MNFFFFKRKKIDQNQHKEQTKKPESIATIIKQFNKSEDYTQNEYKNQVTNIQFTLGGLTTLIDHKVLQNDILPYLLHHKFTTVLELKNIVPSVDCVITTDLQKIERKILSGYVIVRIKGEKQVALMAAKSELSRDVTASEVEYNIEGPKEAFVESLDQNIHLIRQRLHNKDLIYEKLKIGDLSNTTVAVLYIDGLTNESVINTVKERLRNVEYDNILDSSMLEEMITDNRYSPFPLLLNTEVPSKVTSSLTEGKVAILVNGSPFALIGPTTIVSFFGSLEDNYANWYVGSILRLIRVIGVIFSILATPLYVAVITYHPEIIPKELMTSLIASRENVPFPPILEAILMEVAIELLREAGARLPTKVGSTIGIVGGIVLGTATVEAGLTSNVLLIIVAVSALSSFTTPVNKISNTIRIIRFPILLAAQLWGILGINLILWVLLAHLLRQTSLNKPYLEPFYPPRFNDLKDTIIRAPYIKHNLRPGFTETQKPIRFHSKRVHEASDIDE